ncbi:HD-GYP domain-containing protein [Methylobacillus gramineus]|uniref:HD-GYP domain-containing protein n=1 Tax=Methylobacillus gramineus TaxID=755169 RepID=UPI001CFF78C5|nr:HD-GYP domain-containing protein [Methylobacillus gramineus]MCB5185532.1 HD-GYP domain-containing protein [Methylobacillus gramineus]
MLRQIPVSQLRIGMYLHKLDVTWINHPFWRSAFRITVQSEIDDLLSSGVTEVTIDTKKGSDVEREVRPVPPPTIPVPRAPRKVEITEELEQAARICTKAKREVEFMFHEARMGKALDGNQAMALVSEISSSVTRNPSALISLARLKNKDDYTYMHSVAVCGLMIALAMQLDMSEEDVRYCGMAGLLHDIGKMDIPMSVINKPGSLTDDEFEAIKRHPEIGHALLSASANIHPIVLDVCLHHHEKIDGTGYPHQLNADKISLYARMGAICDVYDAITSDRVYRNGWHPADALRKMTEWTSDHLDAKIFQAFVKSLGIYPIGSLVRLESGRLAVVVDKNQSSLLKPKVKVFFSTKSNVRLLPEVIDLSQPGSKDKVVAIEDPADWNFPDFNQLWSDGVPYL